jgi:ABC-2 type transport system ATP-binding protein
VQPGERLALLGPNGAGKSSLIDVITGAVTPTSGSAQVFARPFREVKQRVGVLYEYASLFYNSRVREIIDYIRVVYQTPRKQASDLMQALGVDKYENELVNKLSKGERRKIGVILTLLHDPELVILDEPTSALDPMVRDVIWRLVLNKQRSIFFTTHTWEEAEQYADRIAFIHEGEIIHVDTPASFLSDKYIGVQTRVTIEKEFAAYAEVDRYHHLEEDDKVHVYPQDIDDYLNALQGRSYHYSVAPVTLKDVYCHLIKTRY